MTYKDDDVAIWVNSLEISDRERKGVCCPWVCVRLGISPRRSDDRPNIIGNTILSEPTQLDVDETDESDLSSTNNFHIPWA